jgi:DNA modification methylase
VSALVVRGDARALPLPDASVDLVVTSPPFYQLRSYSDGGQHYEGQIGSEPTPGEYIAALVDCTREWMRVLKPCGSLFVNLGDKYGGAAWKTTHGSGARQITQSGGLTAGPYMPAESRQHSRAIVGTRHKSLIGIPWRYALACVDQLGLILRAEIVWSKPNGLPESVTDRVRRSHEQWFHFVLRPRYYSAVDEIREPHTGNAHPSGNGQSRRWMTSNNGGNHRALDTDPSEYNPLGKLPGSVWKIATEPLNIPPRVAHARCCGGRDPECKRGVDHYAAFPTEWPRRIITGWSPPGICVECGEGRRPVTIADYDHQGRTTNGPQSIARRHESPGREVRAVRLSTITGYACACPEPTAPTTPAVVVDPFGGTGTTALMADVLGRTGISVDRSMDYARLAVWRTTDRAQRAKAMRVPKPPPQLAGQLSLLDHLEAS